MTIEKAVQFPSRRYSDAEKSYKAWLEAGKPKYFSYDSEKGQGFALTKEEYEIGVQLANIRHRYNLLKDRKKRNSKK